MLYRQNDGWHAACGSKSTLFVKPGFSAFTWVHVTSGMEYSGIYHLPVYRFVWSLVFFVMLYKSLFVHFLFWPLYYLYVVDLRLLITFLVSSDGYCCRCFLLTFNRTKVVRVMRLFNENIIYRGIFSYSVLNLNVVMTFAIKKINLCYLNTRFKYLFVENDTQIIGHFHYSYYDHFYPP